MKRAVLSGLGPLDLSMNGKSIRIDGDVTRRCLLRLYLAAGAPVSAPELMESVWGELRPSGLLRAQVNRIRRLVEPFGVIIETGSHGWRLDRGTYVDARDLLQDHLDVLVDERSPTAVAERTAKALALWTGPTLVDLAGVEWAEAETSRVERMRDLLSARHGEALARSGAVDQASVWFAHLSAAHPFDERSAAWSAACLNDLGRVREALDVLTQLRSRLREEIGCAPSELPTLVESLILQQSEGVLSQLPLVAPLETGRAARRANHRKDRRTALEHEESGPSGLAGRSSEWSKLIDKAGPSTRLYMILGDEGSGKSALANSYARLRVRQGAIVLYGAFRQNSDVPHEALADALLSAQTDPRVEAATDQSPLLRALSTFDHRPEIDERPEPIGTAFAGLLRTLSSDADVVLILDDVHWAPASSKTAIERLARTLPPESLGRIDVLVVSRNVGTYGSGAESLARQLRVAGTNLLELRPFSPSEVAELIDRSGRQPSGDVVDAIVKITGGNALFVREVLTHLEDDLATMLTVDDGVPAANELPPSIRRSLHRRLQALSSDAFTVVCLVACHRSATPTSLLTTVLTTRSPAQLHEAVDEALLAGILLQDTANQTVRLQHGLYSSLVLAVLPVVERERFHHLIAAAYGAEGDPEIPGGSPAFIAEHLAAAGSVVPSLLLADWLLRAAEHGRNSGAFESAAQTADRALALLEAHGAPSPEVLRALSIRQLVAANSSDTLTSKAIGARIIRMALGIGDLDAAAQALVLHCSYGRDLREDPDSLALADLVVTHAADFPRARARALAAKAFHCALWLGNALTARDLAAQARGIAQSCGAVDALGESLFAEGNALLATASVARMEDVIAELRSNGLMSGRITDTVRSWRLQALWSLQTGDVVALEWSFNELERLGREPGQWHVLADVVRWQSTLAHLQGRFEEAEHIRSLQPERGFGQTPFVVSAIAQRALQRHSIGALSIDDPLFDSARSNRTALLSLEAVRQEIVVRTGGANEFVLANLLDSVQLLGPHEMDRSRLVDLATLVSWAERAHDAGCDVQAATALLRNWLEPYRASFAVAGYGEHVVGSIARVIGIAESILGRYEDAEAALAGAEHAERLRGWRRAVAETLSARRRNRKRAGFETVETEQAAAQAWRELGVAAPL